MRQNAPEEYYHIYNRGMQKQPIFENDRDRLRFLFLILTFQGELVVKNVSRMLKQSVQSRTLHISDELVADILRDRVVEVVHFCLMPNHFHLMVKELKENGIARYMQRVLTAYTKYFNKRYEKSGHLFQSSYKSLHVSNDEYLMHLSAYIHKNPAELKGWRGKEHEYPWSSYQDCLGTDRFNALLAHSVITDRYGEDLSLYKDFVHTNPAKDPFFLV